MCLMFSPFLLHYLHWRFARRPLLLFLLSFSTNYHYSAKCIALMLIATASQLSRRQQHGFFARRVRLQRFELNLVKCWSISTLRCSPIDKKTNRMTDQCLISICLC